MHATEWEYANLVLSRLSYMQYARVTSNFPAARWLVYHYQSMHNEHEPFSSSSSASMHNEQETFSSSSSASNTLFTSRLLSLKVCKPS